MEVKNEDQKYDMIHTTMNMLQLDSVVVNLYFKDFKDYRLWMQLSQKKLLNGEYEAAIDYLKYGLRQNPTNYNLLYNYSVINEKLKNYNIASKYFTYGQQVNPTSADSFYGEAICQFKLCNYKEAKKAIKKAIKIVYPEKHKK